MAKKRKTRELTIDTINCRETRSMAEKKRRRRNLPLDIIHEILLCLPVKILTKFRLVCKQWNSLISRPSFQQDHYRFHQRNPLLVTVKREYGYHLISTYNNIKGASCSRGTSKNINIKQGLNLLNRFSVANPASLSSRTSRIQSCLGLVCVASIYEHILFVCNPSTGEQIILPPTLEPSKCIGFGYSHSTKEFKVVKFYCTLKSFGRTIGCKVFTLGSGEWREARSPPFETLRVCFGVAPFLQGAFHLLHCIGSDYSITAFDIDTEEYIRFPTPENYNTDDICPFGSIQTLSELGGSLSLIGKHGNFLEVWLVKDYNNGKWVKEYIIDFCMTSPRDFPRDVSLLGATALEILADGSITLALEGVNMNMLLCYNPKEKIATHKMEYGDFSWGLFVESFRSIGR